MTALKTAPDPTFQGTNLYCPRCHTRGYGDVDIATREALLHFRPVLCSVCHQSFDIMSCDVVVDNSHQDIYCDTSNAFRYHWLHVTTTPPEDMVFYRHNEEYYHSGITTHVGQLSTVRDFTHSYIRRDFWCYRLSIRPQSSISPNVGNDFDDWWYVEKKIAHNSGYDVYPYLNRFEASGSVSLLSNPLALQLEDVAHNTIITDGMDRSK